MRLTRFAWTIALIPPAVIFSVWWLTSRDSTSVYFPPLSENLATFSEMWFFEYFTSDLVPSLIRFAVGFCVAVCAGIGVGIALGRSSRWRRRLWPLMEFSRSMPVVALVPLFLIMFGPGHRMEIALIAFAACWPILLNTIDAIRGVDTLQIEMANAYGIGRRTILRQVLVPAALPQVFSGLRIGLAIAMAAMIVGNMFGSSEGIGYRLVLAQSAFNMREMWGALLMIGLIGALVNGIFLLVERRVLAWHRGWRRATGELAR